MPRQSESSVTLVGPTQDVTRVLEIAAQHEGLVALSVTGNTVVVLRVEPEVGK